MSTIRKALPREDIAKWINEKLAIEKRCLECFLNEEDIRFQCIFNHDEIEQISLDINGCNWDLRQDSFPLKRSSSCNEAVQDIVNEAKKYFTVI